MSFFSKMFGRSGKDKGKPVSAGNGNSPVGSGTIIRKDKKLKISALHPDKDGLNLAPLHSLKPEVAQLTEDKSKSSEWKVKTLPVYEPGDVIDDLYQIEDVRSGAMGHVYIATHKKWSVKLAIKAPNERILAERDFYARAIREAKSWTELGLHPNIAYCYYVRSINDVPHIVIEYVDGGNLREWILDGKCLDYKTSLNLAIQFCHGMGYAHSKGMIHRDIKPENILMTKDGILKITDFGLVRIEENEIGSGDQKISMNISAAETHYGDQMGTLTYMAPEQWLNAHDVDERCDIYSFGICLYEMFCGNRPEVEEDIPISEPATLRQDKDFPPSLAEVLKKCIQLNRDDRYDSLTHVSEELTQIYEELFGASSPYAKLELLNVEADGFNNQGISYMELGDTEKAMECWKKALTINPTHLDSTYNQALILWRTAKIADDEVLRRLDSCKDNPSVDQMRFTELKKNIHLERYALEMARVQLKAYPQKYEKVLLNKKLGQIECVHVMKEHKSEVSTVTITPNSRFTVSGSWDRTLRLWNIETGKCIRTMEDTEKIASVCITPNGQHVVSTVLSSFDHRLRMWDLNSGKCVHIMEGHTLEVKAVIITPDGKHAVSASTDKTLRMWDLRSGRCVHIMEGHTNIITTVAVAPNGQYAVSGSWGKNLCMWDLNSGKCVRKMVGHTSAIVAVVIMPDGQYAASASHDQTLRIWELATGKCINIMEGFTYNDRAFSPDCDLTLTSEGRYIVSRSDDQTLRLWERATGHCITIISNINTAALTPDGLYAISGSWDKTLRLWELETGRCLRTMEGHTHWTLAVTLSPDGLYAISGSHDKTLRIWKLDICKPCQVNLIVSFPKSYETRKTVESNCKELIRKAEAFYNRGNYKQAFKNLCLAWKDIGFIHNNTISQLYSLLMKKAKIKDLIMFSHRKLIQVPNIEVNAIALTPNSQYAVSRGHNSQNTFSERSDEILRTWDLKSGQCVHEMEGHTGGVRAATLTPDGRYAVSVSWEATLFMWDLKTGKCERTIEVPSSVFNAIAITLNGQHAILGGNSKALYMWDLETGKCIHTIMIPDYVNSIALTPDGKYAILGGNSKALYMLDLEAGKCIRTLVGHTLGVNAVTVTPNGKYVVSASVDKTIRILDLEAGKCIRTLVGHTDGVKSVTVTPNAKYVVSASHDKTIRMWDLETGQCVRSIKGHTDWVCTVAITSNGRYAVSGSRDKTLLLCEFIWDLEFPDPVDWEEGARPYLEIFLKRHKTKWSESDFQKLIEELHSRRGFPHVSVEGIRKELDQMAN